MYLKNHIKRFIISTLINGMLLLLAITFIIIAFSQQVDTLVVGCILLSLTVVLWIIELVIYLKTIITVDSQKCCDIRYGKTIKTLENSKIQKITVLHFPKGNHPISIILDDGTFDCLHPSNKIIFQNSPKEVSWISLDYTKHRLKLLKTTFEKCPIVYINIYNGEITNTIIR